MTNFHYHLCAAVIFLQLLDHSKANDEEPEDLSDYNLKVLLYRCSLQQWNEDVEELKFKSALVTALNSYCLENYLKCNLKIWSPASEFLPEFVIFDRDYPKISVENVELKFVVVFHTNAKVIERGHLNCVPKEVLATVLTLHRDNISDSSGWLILHSEKFPKYDPITEFMNIGLMPLGLLVGVFVLLLAKMLSWIDERSQIFCVPRRKIAENKSAMSDDQSSTESTDKNQLANVITSEGVEWSAYKPPHKPQDLLVNNNGNKVKSSKIKSAERSSLIRENESPISTLKQSTSDISKFDKLNRPANLPIFIIGDNSMTSSQDIFGSPLSQNEEVHISSGRNVPTMTIEPSSPTSSLVSTGTFLLKPKPLKGRRPSAIPTVIDLPDEFEIVPVPITTLRGNRASDASVNLAVPLDKTKRKSSTSTLQSSGFFSRITKEWGEAAPKRRPNYPQGAKGKTKRSLMSIGAFAMGSASAARVDHRL